MTFRAIEILKQVDLIASEDTRTTRKLLSHFDIHTRLQSYDQHAGSRKVQQFIDMLHTGKSVAVVSEAGTPVISDPGNSLIRECIVNDIQVVPIPGASAVITSLCVSGLNTTAFGFYGFPPRGQKARREFFRGLSSLTYPVVVYESPLRLLDTLASILEEMGDRQIVVARELTKLHEELWRSSVSEAIAEFEERTPRGEFVLIIDGGEKSEQDIEDLKQEFFALKEERLTTKDAVGTLARKYNLPRRAVYQAVLKWSGKSND